MEVCPPPIEVTDFQFKQFSSVRVFPAVDHQADYCNPSCTVAVSNKHGLLFVGTEKGFHILNLARLVAPNASEFINETEHYPRKEIDINAQPSHIELNCDGTLLAVVYKHTDHSPVVSVYKTASLTTPSPSSVKLPVGLPGAYITDLSWNPVIPDLLAFCVSNGSLCLYTHDETGKKLLSHPSDKQVACVSWSPKGKQLLAGDKYGNIVQYKPDVLDPQKVVPPPKDLFPHQCSVLNVIWLSVYQYGAVYINSQSLETHFSIVNAPKNAPVRYVSYEEICFNSGTVRPYQFYLLHVSAWNILIVSSSNSTEVSVLSLLDDKVSWVQLLQEDSTRLDLPIDRRKAETYPVGVTLAMCSQLKIKWGENNFLEPMPTLTIVSNDGLLLLFHVINTKPNTPQLCSPCVPLPDHIFQTAPVAPSVFTASPILSQGQSPVIEISAKPSFAIASPLTLLNKPQISITPVASQTVRAPQTTPAPQAAPAVSLVSAQAPQKPDTQFQAMTASIFQSVIQSNAPTELPPAVKPETKSSPLPPTVVKTSFVKQELVAEPPAPVTVSAPKHKTGTIKKEDLTPFLSLEEKINQLLRSYKLKIGSTDLDMSLTKINNKVDGLEIFFHQLEDTTKSLANEISTMKSALNEAFIYAHESKDQLEKYERRKSDKDPMDGIMIGKKSINPIVEKKLIAIETELRKSSYFVRSYIQDSRPIVQHLELVKSGKHVLNFQSILHSINKEKSMIARCSLMLDEINRDVLRMFSKHHIFKCPKSAQLDASVNEKSSPKPVDRFKSIKEQMKTKQKMSADKLKTLKSLHTTQVLEPIRHLELNATDRIRTSDLLKVFKSPAKKEKPTPPKAKEEAVVKQKVDVKQAVSTPVVSKKVAGPTALFPCSKPEISTNTATFVIDTSNTKANATKLSFDDSIAFTTKNLFTSTPAVTAPAKVSPFGAPNVAPGSTFTKALETPSFGFAKASDTSGGSFGFTKAPEAVPFSFAKASEPGKAQPANSAFQIPTCVDGGKPLVSDGGKPLVSAAPATSLFSSDKSMFGGVAITSSTLTKPASATTTTTFSLSSPANTLGTSQKPQFSAVATTSTFSFSSAAPVSFSFAPASSVAPFSMTSSSAVTITSTSKPSFNFGASVKPFTLPSPVSSSPVPFAASETKTPLKLSQAVPVSSTISSKFEDVTPVTTPTKSKTLEQKGLQKEKTHKKLEEVASGEHPVSAAASNISLTSLLASSEPVPSVTSKEAVPSEAISTSTSESNGSTKVTTTSASSFSFASTSSPSLFEGAPKPVAFSFLSAAKETLAIPASSACSTPSESIASSLSMSSKFGSPASTTSLFSAASKATTGTTSISTAGLFNTVTPTKPTTSIFGASTASNSPTTTVSSFTTLSTSLSTSTPAKGSTDAVEPTPSTPTNPIAEPTVLQEEAQPPSTPDRTKSEAPSTPTSSVTPFGTVLTTPPGSVFSSGMSVFGNTVKEASTTAAFGATTPKDTTTSAAFGAATKEAAAPFGSSGKETAAPAVFGAATPKETSTAAPFGSPAIETAATGFGSAAAKETPTSTADIGNLFGASLGFGSPASPSAPASQPNVFGQSGGNMFNSPSGGGTFGQSAGNIFGGKPSAPAANVFGGGSVFGQTPSSGGNVFGKSVFGDAKPPNPFASAPSPFGQQQNTPTFGSSAFGSSPFGAAKTESSFFGGSGFGNTPTSSSSVFGAPTTSSSSVFGQSAAPFGQSSAFGQSSTFGASPTGGFGAKPNFGQTGGSIFGGKSTFGQSGGSIFGGGSSSSGSVFGGSPSFGSSTGFGSTSPSFGSTGGGAFGAAPSFGSNAAFGGAPAFGNVSPSKIFGSNEPAVAPAPGFGMAASGGLSFGNLAQQTSPQSGGFGSFGGAAPNNTGGVFGNTNTAPPSGSTSSFSSWR